MIDKNSFPYIRNYERIMNVIIELGMTKLFFNYGQAKVISEK